MIGMQYLNFNYLLIWLIIISVLIIISFYFFLTIEKWNWVKKEQAKVIKTRKFELKNQKLHKILTVLREHNFYRIIFYLLVLLALSIIISTIVFTLNFLPLEIGMNRIFLTIIIAGSIMCSFGFIITFFDKKAFNPLSDYGFSGKKILKGICLATYLIQVPLVIYILSSYVLYLPLSFLSKPTFLIYLGLPFTFLYFLGFELIVRGLIQEQIHGSSVKSMVGEFLITSLLYGLFVGICSYIIFMNSYQSVLMINGLQISYSGLFGLIFILFSLSGSFVYMITRTAIAPAISNSLIFIILLSLIF